MTGKQKDVFSRERSYFYLVVFTASIGSAFLFFDGYAQMLFAADYAAASRYFPPLFLSLAMLALLGFGRTLLASPKTGKYVQNVHYTLVFAWLLIIAATPLVDYSTAFKAISPLMLMSLLYLLLVGVSCWKEQNTASRFVVLGLSACWRIIIQH